MYNIISDSNMLILITLAIATAALVLAIINTFKIAHNKKIREINLVNQKDDLNVSMDAIKVTLSKDIRGLKREISKVGRNSKSKENQTSTNQKDVQSEDSSSTESKPVKKRPFNKKRYFNRKSNPKKDSQDNTTANS